MSFDNDTIRKNILQMFSQRGYDIKSEDDTTIIATKTDGNDVIVFLNIITKFNIQEINAKISLMKDIDISHSIIIYTGTPTPAVKNVITSCPSLGLYIELFLVEDLMYNPTTNRFVPKHELTSEKEAKEIREKTDGNIPILLKNDIIARFYDFRRKDIIRVTRADGYISYRIVK